MIQAGLLLLAFNLLFAVLVWLAMYFPGLDLAASVACGYFLFRWIRGLSRVGVSVWQAAGISFISQLPGLILGGLALVSWYLYGPLTSNFDFMLQMWHTPWIPIFSWLPPIYLRGFSLTFLLLYLLSPAYILLVTLFTRFTRPPDQDGNRPHQVRLF